MTLSKNIFLTILATLCLQTAFSQNSMKEPISFKLKNGITVIVAENIGMGKIFASLTSDNNSSSKEGVIENLDLLLNNEAKQSLSLTFGDVDKKINPSVEFSNAEANVSADVTDFNSTFTVMYSTLQGAKINEKTIKNGTSVSDVKDFFNQQFIPSKTVITIAGDITLIQAKALVKRTFGDLKNEDFLAAR